jgi:hypothetical protein
MGFGLSWAWFEGFGYLVVEGHPINPNELVPLTVIGSHFLSNIRSILLN